ncbi:MAG: 4-alpha-glucanotransferase [Dyella sp.]|nr:4-alpha-glucanotransferase [Dyella sp.]
MSSTRRHRTQPESPARLASLPPLQALAVCAGLQPFWHDAWDQPRAVSDEALHRVLDGLGLPSATPAQCEASRAWLAADADARPIPPMVTADRGKPATVRWPRATGQCPYELELESGGRISGTAVRRADGKVVLPAVDTCGYHQLHLGGVECVLAVAPAKCYGVADALRAAGRGADERAWGLSVQIYGLRRGAVAGMGDLGALALCCQTAAREHADAVAINPLHAGFAALPGRYSPYSPSSRLFCNSLYVDPAQIFGQAAVNNAITALGIGEALIAHEARDEIDWTALSPLRHAILRWLWEHRANLLPRATLEAFAAFLVRRGSTLQAHACYESIQAHRLAEASNPEDASDAADWRHWPVTLRTPTDAAVLAFASAHADDVTYHSFLQWLAEEGLAHAQRTARDAGMAIGVIADLAVGTDPGGSHAWSRQGEVLTGFHAGAPPDLYNPRGQDWGVAVFSPHALKRHGYHAFLEMLRANLAQAGGLRVDHALGLARIWLVPAGTPAVHGAYLDFPLQDLLRLVALESWRHHAIIIGENLGTVPPDFNARLTARGVLGIDVLWFEREKREPGQPETAGKPPGFLPAKDWPAQAVATTSTHDLPTVAGWWAGLDLDWRARLGLLAQGETMIAVQAARARERTALWQSLCDAGITSGPEPDPAHAPLEAVLACLGRTRTPLRLVPVEDLLGVTEQPNLPGTIAGHPNWQRRLNADVRHLFDTPPVRARAAAVHSGRPPSGGTEPRGASR